jgi:hypothetical protein
MSMWRLDVPSLACLARFGLSLVASVSSAVTTAHFYVISNNVKGLESTQCVLIAGLHVRIVKLEPCAVDCLVYVGVHGCWSCV